MNKLQKIIFYIELILSILILFGGVIQKDFEYILAAILLFQTNILIYILKEILEIGENYE